MTNPSSENYIEFITLDDEEYFDKISLHNGIIYKPKKYPGPIAIDATIKKETK